ncbi:MAG: YjfI family protein [Psychrosphaera sp.]|nr:YjfI family protein [Psychrosphaera sp.]
MDLQELSIKLADHQTEGTGFESFLISGDNDVLQVIVEGFDELPIFVTVTDEQMLCISYLFNENELKDGVSDQLNSTLLKLNVPMPLSSFAIIEDKYSIFGSLSVNSSFDDIAHELVTLADNAIDALEAIEEFLK